ncbi:MAG TPA: Gfo/Idh/MocA family oxidoreductase [Chloroflexota bacterium]|nr:Gfo/Idh/MocA family oxidoreductase [Chloroflexota bacterium]
MTDKVIRGALLGYGMFGADVVVGTLWDLVRNGIAPYLDRVGLDDFAASYADLRFELLAVGTRSEGSARRAEAETEVATGKRPRGYFGDTPWVEIFRDHPELDVVFVATPDHLHTAPILHALQHGCHVVTEKPMCLDVNEADAIIERAEQAGLVVGADMHKRYDPDHLRIFTELAQDLGTPIYARGVLEEPLEVSTQTFAWVEQSDPFSYVGIHWLDVFMHYLKLVPLSLYAVGQKQRLLREFGKNAFDAVQVMVTHTNGLNAIYENNWLTPADFEGPVNQESQTVFTLGKVESDSQYRGLRYWIENRGSRTANTHFFRKVRRPDGSTVSLGYGKDSLIDCLERICRVKVLGVKAADLAGTYPDARSQRLPTAVVHAAREVSRRNYAHFEAGRAPVCTASFGDAGIIVHDPLEGENITIYDKPITD